MAETESTDININAPLFPRLQSSFTTFLNDPIFQSWKSSFTNNTSPPNNLHLYSAIDIGASNVRVSLQHSVSLQYVQVAEFQSRSSSRLLSGLQKCSTLLSNIFNNSKIIIGSGVDAAGPVKDRATCTITNYSPLEQFIDISLFPQWLCPHDATILLNDLEASAYGIISKNWQSPMDSHFHDFFQPQLPIGHLSPISNYFVMALGTGLGTGLIAGIGEDFHIIPLEAGHLTIPLHGDSKQPLDSSADPGSDHNSSHMNSSKEFEDLLKYTKETVHNGKYYPEYEDLASGFGLTNTFSFCKSQAYKKDPLVQIAPLLESEIPLIISNPKNPKITSHFESDGKYAQYSISQTCSCAEKAMTWYALLIFKLGREGAIFTRSSGIILAGRNQVANRAFFEKHVHKLAAEFNDHPKTNWLKDIRVFVQICDINWNILGCFFKAKQVAPKGIQITEASSTIHS